MTHYFKNSDEHFTYEGIHALFLQKNQLLDHLYRDMTERGYGLHHMFDQWFCELGFGMRTPRSISHIKFNVHPHFKITHKEKCFIQLNALSYSLLKGLHQSSHDLCRTIGFKHERVEDMVKHTTHGPFLGTWQDINALLSRILVAYNPWVKSTAIKFFKANRAPSYDEAVHLAQIGLFKAIRLFDPSQQLSFVKFAFMFVSIEFLRSLNVNHVIDVPESVGLHHKSLQRYSVKKHAQTGEYPTVRELHAYSGLPMEEIESFLMYVAAPVPYEQQDGIHTHESTHHAFETLQGGAGEQVDDARLALKLAMEKLSPSQQAVICQSFGLQGQAHHNRQESATELKMPVSKIRALREEALSALKLILQNDYNIHDFALDS